MCRSASYRWHSVPSFNAGTIGRFSDRGSGFADGHEPLVFVKYPIIQAGYGRGVLRFARVLDRTDGQHRDQDDHADGVCAGDTGFFDGPVLSLPAVVGSDMMIPLRIAGRRRSSLSLGQQMHYWTLRPWEEHPPSTSRSNPDTGLSLSPSLNGRSVKQCRGPAATLHRRKQAGDRL